jgi:16S rRNA (cytidine1402-2'-O)-methyltransferase
MGDFSPRGEQNLRDCDFIAAEDTRVALKLLNKFQIKKPMLSYFEHNKRDKGEYICNRMLGGEVCCLVSDAGMPAISDPGEDLVARCAQLGIPVECVPGPSAVVAAVALSGLPSGRFTFEGFLSMSKKSRFEHLQSIVSETRTMVFYEAPHKLRATLRDLYNTLGERRISVVREITKIHEEVIRTTLSEAAKLYSSGNAKGEFVLVIEGATPAPPPEMTVEQAVSIASGYLEDGMSVSEAAKAAAADTGVKKSDIYKLICEK